MEFVASDVPNDLDIDSNDDGYIDNYTLAYPLLKVLNLPAIFFISTSLIEERHLGWWDIIDYMLKKSRKNTILRPNTKISTTTKSVKIGYY